MEKLDKLFNPPKHNSKTLSTSDRKLIESNLWIRDQYLWLRCVSGVIIGNVGLEQKVSRINYESASAASDHNGSTLMIRAHEIFPYMYAPNIQIGFSDSAFSYGEVRGHLMPMRASGFKAEHSHEVGVYSCEEEQWYRVKWYNIGSQTSPFGRWITFDIYDQHSSPTVLLPHGGNFIFEKLER